MNSLPSALVEKLHRRSVRHEVQDDNTVVLASVPTADHNFNQPVTALMVKRPRPGTSFLVGVDETLMYLGEDGDLVRTFRGAICRQGWKTLMLTLSASLSLDEAVSEALAILGFDGAAPRVPRKQATAARENSLLSRFGRDLTAEAIDGELPETIGREEEVIDLLSTLIAPLSGQVPVVVGSSGAGKTAVLHGAAALARDRCLERRFVALNLAELVAGVTFDAELENLFVRLIREAELQPDLVLALEHFELMMIGRIPRVLAESLHRGRLTMAATMQPEFLNRLRAPLSRRISPIRLRSLPQQDVRQIVQLNADRIAPVQKVRISTAMVDVCMRLARDLPGLSPSKELALMDLAAARCRLTGHTELSADDLHFTKQRIVANSRDDEADEE